VNWLPLEKSDIDGALREGRIHGLLGIGPPLYAKMRDNLVQYAIEFQAVGALPPDLEIRSFVECSYAEIKTHA
jgi:hypothetical protein